MWWQWGGTIVCINYEDQNLFLI